MKSDLSHSMMSKQAVTTSLPRPLMNYLQAKKEWLMYELEMVKARSVSRKHLLPFHQWKVKRSNGKKKSVK